LSQRRATPSKVVQAEADPQQSQLGEHLERQRTIPLRTFRKIQRNEAGRDIIFTQELHQTLRKLVIPNQARAQIDIHLQREPAFTPLSGLTDGLPHHKIRQLRKEVLTLQ